MNDYDLVLIRGLPGSGKSTKAKELEKLGFVHLEADMYFIHGDQYIFNIDIIEDAHAWCLAMTKFHLNQGSRVVVSNTFTKSWELEQYMMLDCNKCIAECDGEWGSVHNTPTKAIESMRQRWEPTIKIAKLYNVKVENIDANKI